MLNKAHFCFMVAMEVDKGQLYETVSGSDLSPPLPDSLLDVIQEWARANPGWFAKADEWEMA